MRKPSLFVRSVSLLTLVVTMDDASSYRTGQQWQVWLYQEGVHIPRYTAGLQYSRWGQIQGRSAEGVKDRQKLSHP
jgi:hypothetical protein